MTEHNATLDGDVIFYCFACVISFSDFSLHEFSVRLPLCNSLILTLTDICQMNKFTGLSVVPRPAQQAGRELMAYFATLARSYFDVGPQQIARERNTTQGGTSHSRVEEVQNNVCPKTAVTILASLAPVFVLALLACRTIFPLRIA